jgi:hypothetical protein
MFRYMELYRIEIVYYCYDSCSTVYIIVSEIILDTSFTRCVISILHKL